jgi:uncharacterized protein (TIGR03000 family)
MNSREWFGVSGTLVALAVLSQGPAAFGQERGREGSVPSTPTSTESRETNQTRPTPLTGRDLDSSGNPDRALNNGTPGRAGDYGLNDRGRYDNSGNYMRDGYRAGDYGRLENGYGADYGSGYGSPNFRNNEGYYGYGRRGYGYGYDRSYYPDYSYNYQQGGYYAPAFGAQSGWNEYDRPFGTSMSSMGNNQVLIRVIVPRPDARVTFEGEPTRQMGFDRLYISPPLEPGQKYAYTIKATWQDTNGKQVNKTDTLHVRANELLVADFVHQPGQQARNNTIQAAPTPNQELGRQELSEPDRNRGSNNGNPRDDGAQTITGKVISLAGDRLTITDSGTSSERTFRLPANTSVQLNGKDSQTSALKAGMQVTIDLKDGSRDQIKSIEADEATATGK